MPVKAVIFDLDDTLVENRESFSSMRERYERRLREEGYPPPGEGPGLLEGVEELCRRIGDSRPMKLLEELEMERAETSSPGEGAEELLRWLKERGIKVGVVTRNSRRAALRALGPMADLVDVLLTRDDTEVVKPHPGQILRALEILGVRGEECVVVGDYVYDVEASRGAGCTAVCLGGRAKGDFNIERLEELKNLLQKI